MQGFLKKQVKDKGLFQRKDKTLKRYFVLDHHSKKMRIHKTNDPKSEYTLFEYNEIFNIDEYQLTIEQKMKICERWSFSFVLSTSKRDYKLYAASNDERDLWVHCFKWIIESNAFIVFMNHSKYFSDKIKIIC